jgi:hypothetical protein
MKSKVLGDAWSRVEPRADRSCRHFLTVGDEAAALMPRGPAR